MNATLGFLNLVSLICLPMIPLRSLNDSSALFLLWPLLVLWFAYHSKNALVFTASCWVSFLILFFALLP